MKRKISFLLVCVIIFCSACSSKNQPANKIINLADKAQYVIAMNPSIMESDGTITSVRNSAAAAMKKDSSKKSTTAFYDSTPWKLVTHEITGDWNKRIIRTLSTWSDASGNTKRNAPFSYKFSDDQIASLTVYDSSKMDIKGVDKELNKSGVILSFGGKEETGLSYTAEKDCYIQLSDQDDGNISIVKSISGMSTSFIDNKKAESSIILRIYKNNRIYWQQILNKENTSVKFPEFSGMDLLEGESILITAEPVSNTDGIVVGNCDLPAKTKEITTNKRIENTVLVENKLDLSKQTFSFVKDGSANFSIVRSDNCPESTKEIISNFNSRIEKVLDVYPEYITEYEMGDDMSAFYIVIGKAECEESKKAQNEILTARKENAADFIIRRSNNKIIITADNDYSLKNAIEFFFNNYCKNDESQLEPGLNYVSSQYNPVRSVRLGDADISNYKIVHSRYYSFMESEAVDYLVDSILKITGKIVTVSDDSAPKSAYEILIGDTNRTSSDYFLKVDATGGVDYTINVGGSATSVLSVSNSAVNAGTIDLVNRINKGNVTPGTYKGSYDGSYSLTNGYRLSWSEDFNGDKLSKTWNFKDADGYDTMHGGKTIGKMENAVVKDGALNALITRRGNDFDVVTIGTAGVNAMAYRYGYLEGRIKFPDELGYGSSLWSVTYGGALGYGEFDVFESAGKLDTVAPNLHSWSTVHTNILGGVDSVANYGSTRISIGENFYEKYHYFGMDWTDDTIKFYVDGKCRFTFDCTKSAMYDIFDQYANVNLCFTADDAWTKTPVPDNSTGNCAYVDWVRVWQKDEPGYGIRIK